MPLQDHEKYNAYMRDYMLRRYHKRRALLIEQLGGVCVRCGSTDRLEFDHTEKPTKSFSISKFLASASMKKIMEELTKIQLLCNPHHIEKSRECGDYTSLPR